MRIRNSLAAAAVAAAIWLLPSPGLAQLCPGSLLDERIQLSRAGADAGDPVSLHCHGLALMENQQLAEAQRYLQRLASRCPRSLGAANNLAIAMAGAGDHGAALAELGRLGDPDTMIGAPNAEVLRRNRAAILAIQRFWDNEDSLAAGDSLSLEVIDPIDACLPEGTTSATAAEESVPPAAAETTVTTDSEGADEEDDDPVFDAVSDWVVAWEDQDVDGYLAAYSRRFVPPDGLSRAAWEEQRRRRLTAPQFITIELDEYEDQAISESLVEVRFVQSYRSNRFQDTVRKTLRLVLEDGAWKILSELASSSGSE